MSTELESSFQNLHSCDRRGAFEWIAHHRAIRRGAPRRLLGAFPETVAAQGESAVSLLLSSLTLDTFDVWQIRSS